MRKIREINNRQSFWSIGQDYVIVSTDINNTEVMIFQANAEGEIVEWNEQYVSFANLSDHGYHMTQFQKECYNELTEE